MKVVVVTKDGRKHVFNEVDGAEAMDIVVATTEGAGFSVLEGKKMVAYGPGTVRRVAVIEP